MKKTLIMVGMCVAGLCYALALSIPGQSTIQQSKQQAANVAEQAETDTPTTGTSDAPSVGVSIGTVEALEYWNSGLNLNYFGNAEYVAKISDNTYLGFSVDANDWYYDPETGEEYPINIQSASLTAINSTESAVTIPDSIQIRDEIVPVTSISSYSSLANGFSENIKYLTIPASVVSFSGSYAFDRNLNGIYMLGSAPSSNWNLNANLYICNEADYNSYLSNDRYAYTALIPYGWDFEWITVNVEKNGEFAETYLTQNDYDWGAAQYVKVTGNINDIDLSAIKNLTSLLKLDLSETGITELPSEFMYNRRSLVDVKLPSTLSKIGDYAFYNCTSLESFDLNGIENIGNNVFSSCTSLSFINLKGVATIGRNAFSYCINLSGIDLSTVTSIGSSAFDDCTSIDSVNISSVTNLGSSAFQGCSSLSEIVFSPFIKSIPSSAFSSTALVNLEIPEGITTIESYSFQGCNELTSVTLPSTLQTINHQAFRDCSNLASVNLNTGLLSINERAFYNCTALEEITIPSTVIAIGSDAFAYTSIKSFKCYAVVPPEANNSFIGNGMDMSRTYLYVPPFSKDFYRNTQYWSNFYLMSSIKEPIDYIQVDRPLTINLEEEDNEVVANNPTMLLTFGNNYNVGQLTATGEGTLSAGQLDIVARKTRRNGYYNSYNLCPTLINYADKMRADNVSNTFYFQNYYSSGEWHFISLPYDVKVSDIAVTDDTYWVIRRYDSAARAAGETAETWVNLTADDTLEAGKGYIISAVRDGNEYLPGMTFSSGNSLTKNNIFRSIDVEVNLTEYPAEFAHNRSWNFIGNPYPCYFDMHFLNEEFTAPVTIWNGSSYVAYSPVDDDLVLAPYEAFFVQCPLDSKEMIFGEAGRLHHDAGNASYKSPVREITALVAEDRNVFNFNLTGENIEDRARIVLNPEATSEYEIGRDASKFFADNSTQLFVNADVNYSICERPVNDGTATLGIRANAETSCTISLSGRFSSEWNVILTDNLTGASVDLTTEDYTFTAVEGQADNRFSVKFTLNLTGVDAISDTFGNDANITVTAVNGMTVFNGRLSEISVPAPGLYIITDGKETRKAILK